MPIYANAQVRRDHHIEVAKALYSVPGNLIGQQVEVRADRGLVRVYARGQIVKVHPRQAPGGRVTDPDDLPAEHTAYAMRDLDKLNRIAIGPFHRHRNLHRGAARASVALEQDAPGLRPARPGQEVGPDRINTACASTLEHEAINVGLIGRMLERATKNNDTAPAAAGTVVAARLAPDPDHFGVQRPATGTEGAPR